jgi:hypothetical protein
MRDSAEAGPVPRSFCSRDATRCSVRYLALAAGLALLAPGPAGAQATYRIQSIVKIGDTPGSADLAPLTHMYGVSLNDSGQILFSGISGGANLVLQYADGKLTPINAPGGDGPAGPWPEDSGLTGPLRMNQQGNAVFYTGRQSNNEVLGTFLWHYKERKVTAVARPELPAVGDFVFVSEGFARFPTINNHDEVAFPSVVRNPRGEEGMGLFFLPRDGRLLPVLLPGQELPGGGPLRRNSDRPMPSLTDAGAIAFRALRSGASQYSAYVWEQGTLRPLVLVGAEAPGGGKVTSVGDVFLNNRDRSALVSLGIGGSRNHGLYRVVDGKLAPVVVPGQAMPDGGVFKRVLNVRSPDGPSASAQLSGDREITVATETGEHAFLAELADGSTAAYRLALDGTLSLILKSGTTTELGRVLRVGDPSSEWSPRSGVGLNSTGEVALIVRFDNGDDTLVLLTPAAP